jgi:hypothetical protein
MQIRKGRLQITCRSIRDRYVSTRCCEGREEREEEDGWHLLLDAERLRRDVQHLLVVVGVGVPCQHRRRCRRHSQREEQEQQRH